MRVLALGLIAFAVATQVPPGATSSVANNTALLMGVVVDASGDLPVPGAQVTLGGSGAAAAVAAGAATAAASSAMGVPEPARLEVLTDAEGRFIFMDLPKGNYTIAATQAGYADGGLGRRRPGGLTQTLSLAEGERIGNLKIPVWKLAAITGQVVDDAGEPMVGLPVRALSHTIVAGHGKLTPDSVSLTDDRGIYRLGALVPGTYAVAITSTQASAPESVVDRYTQEILNPPTARDLMQDMSMNGGVTAVSLFQRYGGIHVGPIAFLPTAGPSLSGVSPGPGSDGRFYVHPTQFYADALAAADASAIALRSGEERSGVDMHLRLLPASRVSGTLKGPDGPLIAILTLTPDADDFSTDSTLETATTLSDAAGQFTFLGVPTGRYQLRAYRIRVPPGGGSRGAPPPSPSPSPTAPAGTSRTAMAGLAGETLWMTQQLTVGDSDIDGLAIMLRPGFRISGHVVFTGARAQPDGPAIHRMRAVFEPADGRPLVTSIIGNGQFDESGQLSTYQLPPGRYVVRIENAPPGWTFDGATVGNRDISNVPLLLDRDVAAVTINFTDRPCTILGQVTTTAGAPDPSATVLILPADPNGWTDTGRLPRRLRSIRVDRDGQYRVTELPPGDYRIVAILEDESANWQDPQTLQRLARVATSVTLTPAETRTLSLRTTTVSR